MTASIVFLRPDVKCPRCGRRSEFAGEPERAGRTLIAYSTCPNGHRRPVAFRSMSSLTADEMRLVERAQIATSQARSCDAAGRREGAAFYRAVAARLWWMALRNRPAAGGGSTASPDMDR